MGTLSSKQYNNEFIAFASYLDITLEAYATAVAFSQRIPPIVGVA